MVNTWEELGKQVASARKDRRLTQVELAEALGVDRTAITKIEVGERKVDSLELAKLADILRRPVHWFVHAPSQSVTSPRGISSVSRNALAYSHSFSRSTTMLALRLRAHMLRLREVESG